jgi:hypothetical protein
MDKILENLVEDASMMDFRNPHFREVLNREARERIMEEIERCRWEIYKNQFIIDECWERLGEVYD